MTFKIILVIASVLLGVTGVMGFKFPKRQLFLDIKFMRKKRNSFNPFMIVVRDEYRRYLKEKGYKKREYEISKIKRHALLKIVISIVLLLFYIYILPIPNNETLW